jgi:hypothetical protein
LDFLPPKTLIAVQYRQGFNSSLGNTTSPCFSLGMEYPLHPVVPLRTGITVGGDDKIRWSMGLSIDYNDVDLDFATDNAGFLFLGNNFQMFSASFGMKMRF